MSKNCLHCGKKLSFLSRDRYCSSAHSELHHDKMSQLAFQRLLDSDYQPAPRRDCQALSVRLRQATSLA